MFFTIRLAQNRTLIKQIYFNYIRIIGSPTPAFGTNEIMLTKIIIAPSLIQNIALRQAIVASKKAIGNIVSEVLSFFYNSNNSVYIWCNLDFIILLSQIIATIKVKLLWDTITV